uniref:Uncharacterized protein n=1 Tax=Glossina austeni TaxID=7395 RepID=A0A1A9UKX4_GLOAU
MTRREKLNKYSRRTKLEVKQKLKKKRFGNNSPMLMQRTRYGRKSDLVTYKRKSFLANPIENWPQTPHDVHCHQIVNRSDDGSQESGIRSKISEFHAANQKTTLESTYVNTHCRT